MTEEANLPKTEEAQAKKAAPAKKRGRKPGIKKAPKAVYREVETQEEPQAAPTVRPHQATRGWPTRKAFRCKIHGDQNQLGHVVPFQLGDSTKIQVLRGVEVILPWDCKGIMDDAVVDMPVCRWKGAIPEMSSEKYSRIPYSFMGECTWEEYESYRAE